MKKQIPVILLSTLCTGLAVALYMTNRTKPALEQEPDNTTLTAVEPSAEQAVLSEPAPAVPAVEKIADPVQETVEELIAEEEPESGDRRMMKNIAKMLENPSMNKMMEASQRGAITSMYGDLIQQLNLSSEEEAYFMDLLMFRQMTQVNAGMKMMAGNLSDEEKTELQTQMEDATELVKAEMKNFLNSDEDYESFEFFEKTLAERMMLSQAESSLTGTDNALSEETYEGLVQMMADQKENFSFTSSLNDSNTTGLDANTFSSQNLENFKADQEALNLQILAEAEAMLSPEQYTAFEDALKSFTEMQIAQMDMAAQMLGGGE